MSDIYKFFDDYLDKSVNDPVKSLKDFITSSAPTPEQSESGGQAVTPPGLDNPPSPAPSARPSQTTPESPLGDFSKFPIGFVSEGAGNEFTRGVSGATYGTLPKLGGDFLDMIGVLSDSSTLSEAGRKAAAYGEANQKSMSPRVPSYTKVRHDTIGHFVDDAFDYGMGTSGGAVGTSIPILGLGLLAGIPGAVAGSYILNSGDAYGTAKRDPEILKLIEEGKLTSKQVARYSAVAGGPMALLDAWGAATILGPLTKPFKNSILKHIVESGITEMTTEALQESISLANQEVLGGDVKKQEAIESIINNALGGLLGGAPTGGIVGAITPSREEMLQDRMNALDIDTRPPVIREIEALVRGEPQVFQDTQIETPEAANANRGSIYEAVNPLTGKTVGEYLRQEDVPEGLTVQEVPQTDAARYNAAVERQVTRRGMKNAFRLILPEAEPNASLTPGLEPEVFYSQLQRVVEDKKFPARGKGSDLLNKIKNSPGVKAEEIEWTGLEDFLVGREKVTKEEIISHLEENQVQIEEALYGTSKDSKVRWISTYSGTPVDPDEPDNRILLREQVMAGAAITDEYDQFRLEQDSDGRYHLTFNNGNGEYHSKWPTFGEALTHAQEYANSLLGTEAEGVGRDEGFAGAPKYGTYVLQGPRRNYRELLLKWAPPLPPKVRALQEEFAKGNKLLQEKRANARTNEERRAYLDLSERFINDPARIEATRQVVAAEREREEARYTEPHFGQDVLAWVRMSERFDESGQKVLFIEELQSKWHQRGRAESYSQEVDEYAIYRKRDGEKIVDGDKEWITEELSRLETDSANPARYEIRKTGKKMKIGGAVPNAPFKSNWLDLLFKRMIRYAADHGYSRIAWTTGKMQSERYGSHESTNPVAAIYDKVLPPIARKWARSVGGTVGTTVLENTDENKVEVWLEADKVAAFPTRGEAVEWINRERDNYGDEMAFEYEIRDSPSNWRVPFVDLPQSVFEQKPSFPLFKRTAKGKRKVATANQARIDKLRKQIEPLLQAVDVLAQKLGVFEDYEIHLLDDFQELSQKRRGVSPTSEGLYYNSSKTANGKPVIFINMSRHLTAEELWSTLTHEVGHLVVDTALKRAPDKVKYAIANAFEVWRQSIRPTERITPLMLRSWSAMRLFPMDSLMTEIGADSQQFGDLTQDDQAYYKDFTEWFAEELSKWATTSEKPLTVVDKFFKGLANKLKRILSYMRKKFVGYDFEPNAVVKNWLDDHFRQQFDLGPGFFKDVTNAGHQENINALTAVGEDSGGAIPVQGETLGARNVIDNLGELPPQAKRRARADAAHTDRLAWRHKMFFGLLELVERFKHIPALVAYKEDMQAQMLMQQVLTDEAEVVRKAWDKLDPTQNQALAYVMDDFMNMTYRTDEEVKAGVARNPTRDEFQALARKHGLDDKGVNVFRLIRGHFNRLFDVYEQVLLDNVRTKGYSPEIELVREAMINEQFNKLRARPFTPLMHFGRHAVEVRDAAGNLIQREFYDSPKLADKAIFALNRRLSGTGYIAKAREFRKESLPFINFPTALQRAINEQLELTEGQAEDVATLVADGDPVPLYRHKLLDRKSDKSYPHRLKRSFAWYSTRGATYIARLKFNAPLSAHIKQLHDEAKFMPDSALRDGLANFLADHKKEQYSNRTDFAQLRAAGFFMYLGFMVPSAALNLTQAFFGTAPFLMAKFGPIASAYILHAGTSRVQYYKKGTLEGMTAGEGRAMNRAVKEKIVDESAAVELAGLSEGHNLLDRAGPLGPQAGRAFVGFKHAAAYLFTMAEKLLRRNSFLSAYKLAMDYPANPFVAESVRMAPQKFNQLLGEGWSRAEAAAYVTAQRTVEQTQYDYSRYAQPKFMRGVGRPLFMFKRFQHATLFMLYNHPKTLLYWVPLTLFFAGLMGLPGMEDLRGISKWIAMMIFGKDFDIEKEARKFILEAFGGEKEILGREYFLPDLITDGLSKYGFGLPHFLDMLGGTVGVDVPFPTLDRSRALGLGKLIPLPFDELSSPDTRDDSPEFKAIKEAAGPIFGWAFQAFAQAREVLQHPGFKPNDEGLIPRQWEPMAPKIVGRVSQAYRAYKEQATTTPSGETIVKYDPRDAEQSAELIAKALGYQPLRESMEYEQIRRQSEAITLWDTRRQMLLDQYWTAHQAKDPQEIKSVREAIVKFNQGLPPEARGKKISFGKGGTIDRSIKARTATKAKRAKGEALRKSDQSLVDEIRRLYPGSNPVSVQKVR